MQPGTATELAEPRLENPGTLHIAGISRHYPFDAVAGIPDQWQTFVPLIPRISADPAPATYGVIYNGGDDSFDYLTGVEMPSGSAPPENVVCLTLAPYTYLVFQHALHVAVLRETCNAIWSEWLPASGHIAAEAPWFERYGASFDPQTGEGGLEVWIPILK